jgi:hypothetical protein
MRIFKLLTGLFLFIAGGIYGIFSNDYVQIYLPIYNWFIILAFPIGVYYAFSLLHTQDKSKKGGIALGRIGITIVVTMIVFRSIQGYIILYNCNIGPQAEVLIEGKITQLRFPKPKKFFDKNSIDILASNPVKTISLEVPSNNYNLNELFQKNMTRGSLGILYSSK